MPPYVQALTRPSLGCELFKPGFGVHGQPRSPDEALLLDEGHKMYRQSWFTDEALLLDGDRSAEAEPVRRQRKHIYVFIDLTEKAVTHDLISASRQKIPVCYHVIGLRAIQALRAALISG